MRIHPCDLDLTEAVEAAESALGDPDYIGCSCCAQFPEGDEDPHHAIARQAVTAPTPPGSARRGHSPTAGTSCWPTGARSPVRSRGVAGSGSGPCPTSWKPSSGSR